MARSPTPSKSVSSSTIPEAALFLTFTAQAINAKVLDALPRLGGPFNLAYIDAVKGDGPAYGIKL